jgi:O-6-methylguanine DNA methyltransferase
MNPAAFCLFDTSIGRCGIAWRQRQEGDADFVVTALQLPEATPQETASRIALHSGGHQTDDLPTQILAITQRIHKHLNGELQDFRDVPVDLNGAAPFVREVCEAARKIPAGKTVSYSDLAKTLGHPATARAVGSALGKNPVPLIIPCHRVQAAGGRPGGFSAYGGRATKAKLLAIEGAVVNLCLALEADS